MRGRAITALLCAGTLLGICPAASLAQAQPQPTQPTQPAGQQAAQQQDPVAALRKLLTEHPELLDQLRALLDQMAREKAGGQQPAKPGAPEIPPIEIPGEPAQPTQPGALGQPAQPGGPLMGTTRASLTPEISVIGNHIGRFISVHGDPDRNQFLLNEVEVGLQQPIYPGIRFDAFLNAGLDDDFKAGFEEAYVTMSQVGHLPVGALLGKKRLDFGKVNPLHPHSRLYVDQPAALAYLLDPDSLNGDGASVNYLFPFKNIFANLELGLWKVNPSDAGITVPGELPEARAREGVPGAFYPVGAGITNNLPLGRLWISKDFNGGSELEMGASHAFGKADIGDKINITGLDLTYRTYPTTFSRIMLQGEQIWHHRTDDFGGTGGHTRAGHYVLASYRPDQFYEYGVRYDNTRLPWPLPGRETSLSFIWTNRLTEVTLLRLQYKIGDRTSDILLPSARRFNEIYLQFIWGGGSHTHPLQ